MKDWFLKFPLREQVALLLLGGALLLYLIYMLMIRPLGVARTDLANRNAGTAETLQRVDVMVTQIRELRKGAGGSTGPRTQNLTALLNESAGRFSLPISRLQPNSRGAVQIRFEAVSLESLLRWIHQLETVDNVAVEELSMTQTSSAGIVGANLRVAART